MILEALFRRPAQLARQMETLEKTGLVGRQNPAKAPVPSSEHSLSSIVATQASGSVEEWEARRDAHNAMVVRERARRKTLLPIERAGLPELKDFEEKTPVLRIAGMDLPRIDKDYVCSAAKKFGDKYFPAFAIYDIDGGGVATWTFNSDGDQLAPYKLLQNYARAHFQRDEHPLLRSRGSAEHKFTGVIPDSARERVRTIRASGELPQKPKLCMGHDFGEKYPNIFLIEEAYAWSKPEIRNPDPLIVVEKDGAWYLLDKFDVTPMEWWLLQEQVG